jgi:hypothetical protein
MGAVAWGPLAIAPFPIPAHQTGRADFRHPAFRLASLQGTRRSRLGQALEAQNAEFSMDYIECKSTIAAPLHLVPSREEPAHWASTRPPDGLLLHNRVSERVGGFWVLVSPWRLQNRARGRCRRVAHARGIRAPRGEAWHPTAVRGCSIDWTAPLNVDTSNGGNDEGETLARR